MSAWSAENISGLRITNATDHERAVIRELLRVVAGPPALRITSGPFTTIPSRHLRTWVSPSRRSSRMLSTS